MFSRIEYSNDKHNKKKYKRNKEAIKLKVLFAASQIKYGTTYYCSVLYAIIMLTKLIQ